MKKFTKLAASLMCAVMLFSFFGCQNPASDDNSDKDTKKEQETTTVTEGEGENQGSEGENGNETGNENTGAVIPEELKVPLTFEAITDGKISVCYPWSTLKYKINDGELKAVQTTHHDNIRVVMPQSDISVHAGDKVSFFANGSENSISSNSFKCQTISVFSVDANTDPEFYIYGNVMSLLDAENYSTKKDIEDDYAFAFLFENGDVYLKNHNSKKLVLPATTLSEGCYCDMFIGCEGITVAPELPATILEPSCYAEMFKDCYALTKAPELPAQTLAASCYFRMFDSCNKLNYVKCLATDFSAEECTYDWLYGVAQTGTFVKAADANIIRSKIGLPDGWTIEGATKYSVTINNSEHGSVSSDKATAEEGQIVTLTIAPDNYYELQDITVSVGGKNLKLSNPQNNKVSFSMPAFNVEVSASFKPSLIGTKAKPTEVGDIVFNDGSALPASEYSSRNLTDREKQNAIAVVGAKSGDDSVLIVGLKQEFLSLCTEDSQGYNNTAAFSKGEEIDTYEAILNANGANEITDYNDDPDKYPAFKWAFNYLGKANDHWFIPTLNELKALYQNISDIKSATDKLGTEYSDILAENKDKEYSSVTIFSNDPTEVYFKDFANGSENTHSKKDKYPVLVIKEIWY